MHCEILQQPAVHAETAARGSVLFIASLQAECPAVLQDPAEASLLGMLNARRQQTGQEPVQRLTVGVLNEALRGSRPGGQPWKRGQKKREELLADFRCSPRCTSRCEGHF